ncbi:hypothetical protein C1645_789039 [Glomus cerebriforme]|uniref:Restriction endonuclease domain-containing protein n=1 Tax=Glomus cerebriforme TaxID=658196 RepID=A0A397S9B4_9GLOM|nr:hypothetical protein C1645_789039 [Glomus cerebriforme]
MSLYTGSSNASFSSISSIRTRTSSASSDVPERMSDCHFYRNLWWDKGEFNKKAKWEEEVTLPYVLAKGITIEDYEERVEKFNIHGCWEWLNGEVIIYELPSMPHEVGIGAITSDIIESLIPVKRTDAEIYSCGATRTRDSTRGKEADASFRPKKPAVTAPDGSDRDNRPWPNLVVEVAYTETMEHVEEALKYWLSPGRAHDCIIVKIDPVPSGQVPVRMRAWHYCIDDRRTRNNIPHRTEFEFGTQDGAGTGQNITPGQRIINISLDCLYHDFKQPDPPAQPIQPRNLLPDPIPLDFYYVQRAIREMFNF